MISIDQALAELLAALEEMGDLGMPITSRASRAIDNLVDAVDDSKMLALE